MGEKTVMQGGEKTVVKIGVKTLVQNLKQYQFYTAGPQNPLTIEPLIISSWFFRIVYPCRL
jgi:hypothetical protein